MNQIQIFIISDNQDVCQSLSSIISRNNSFELIGAGSCTAETFSNIKHRQPDVILYGLKADQDVQAVIGTLKENCPYSKLIVVGSAQTPAEERTAINLGVAGCIPDDMLPCHLESAIQLTCLTGIMWIPSSLKGLLEQPADVPEPSYQEAEDLETSVISLLTGREIDIYKLLVRNYSNRDIGNTLYISQPTVKTHVSNILRKLGLENRMKLIMHVMQPQQW